jgi:hypothetical protein
LLTNVRKPFDHCNSSVDLTGIMRRPIAGESFYYCGQQKLDCHETILRHSVARRRFLNEFRRVLIDLRCTAALRLCEIYDDSSQEG